MSGVAEASQLIFALAPKASTRGERRLAAWRKVAQHFTFNRICELDRKSDRARVTVEEISVLREAADQEDTYGIRALLARIDRMEAELAELRAFTQGGSHSKNEA